MRTESGSSFSTFMTCPKKYHFAYEQKLSSPNYSSNLSYGSFVHGLREVYHASKISPGLWKQAQDSLEAFLQKTYLDYPKADKQILFDIRLAKRVVDIWANYWEKSETSMSEGLLEWLDVEGEWSIPIGSNGDMHVGKRDGFLKHLKWGNHFLYELKTASSADKDSYLYRLHLDYQINGNLLALHREGKKFDGVIYDIIWKPAIRLKTGRKTMPDETLDEFLDRMVEEYQNNPDEYFTRITVSRTNDSLLDYEVELEEKFRVLSDMRVKYRNSSACKQFNTMCQFFDLCMDPTAQEQKDSFFVRDRKHPELKTGE